MGKESLVLPESYCVIQGFMRTKLGLKGNELLCYAVIYGFCQINDHTFHGSLSYLSEWTGATKRSVMDTLKSLVEKGLLIKDEETVNGVKVCHYGVKKTGMENISPPMEKTSPPPMENFSGVWKNFQGGMEKFSPNNIEDNIDIYNTHSIKNARTCEEPQKPTENGRNDIKNFCDKYGIGIDNYSSPLIAEMDWGRLDKEFSQSRFLKSNNWYKALSNVVKGYKKIITGCYRDNENLPKRENGSPTLQTQNTIRQTDGSEFDFIEEYTDHGYGDGKGWGNP